MEDGVTVKEVREAAVECREEIKRAVADAIAKFQERTDIPIEGVSIDFVHETTIEGKGTAYVAGVDLSLRSYL